MIIETYNNITDSSNTQVLHKSNIVNDLCSTSVTSGSRELSEIVFIIWHSTANTKAYADAIFHREYQDTTSRKVSWHYTIDDIAIYRNHYDYKICNHSGDNGYNTKSIGIEVCQNEGANIDYTMANVRELYGYLSQLYPEAKHILHSDVTGKDCPSFEPLKRFINEQEETR